MLCRFNPSAGLFPFKPLRATVTPEHQHGGLWVDSLEYLDFPAEPREELQLAASSEASDTLHLLPQLLFPSRSHLIPLPVVSEIKAVWLLYKNKAKVRIRL